MVADHWVVRANDTVSKIYLQIAKIPLNVTCWNQTWRDDSAWCSYRKPEIVKGLGYVCCVGSCQRKWQSRQIQLQRDPFTPSMELASHRLSFFTFPWLEWCALCGPRPVVPGQIDWMVGQTHSCHSRIGTRSAVLVSWGLLLSFMTCQSSHCSGQ